MAFKSPEKKKKLKMVSHYMEVELSERMKKAASEDNTTMTSIINFAVNSYLDDRDKYYDPNDMQPEDLQKEQEEAEAEAEQWTPLARKPVEEEDEEVENPIYEDPPPGYDDGPESPDQADQPDIF